MGQARNRGTREERVAQAIDRDAAEAEKQAARAAERAALADEAAKAAQVRYLAQAIVVGTALAPKAAA